MDFQLPAYLCFMITIFEYWNGSLVLNDMYLIVREIRASSHVFYVTSDHAIYGPAYT